MDTFVIGNIAATWLIVAAILLVVEIFSGGAVGFLFAGIGALITGGLLVFDILDHNAILLQLIIFCISSIASATVLWIPLQKFRHKQSGDPYVNIVGTTAKVVDRPLIKGKTGNVKWSGTFMRAIISPSAPTLEIAVDTEVTVVAVKGNKLIVELPQ